LFASKVEQLHIEDTTKTSVFRRTQQMKPDYADRKSHPSTFPEVRPEIVLSSVSEINLKDKDKTRPETVTEVAPETSPYKKPKPEVVTEVAPESEPAKKPSPETITEVAPETSPYKKPKPEVVTEVAPESEPARRPRPEVVTEVAPETSRK
jgi:hypothetical protein